MDEVLDVEDTPRTSAEPASLPKNHVDKKIVLTFCLRHFDCFDFLLASSSTLTSRFH